MSTKKLSIQECESHLIKLRQRADAESGDRIITASGQILEMEQVTIRGQPQRTWKTVSSILLDS